MSNKNECKQKIFFRVDGSRQLGLGHISRAINLAEELARQAKARIIFVFKKNALVKSLLSGHGFEYLAFDDAAGLKNILGQCTKRDIFITDSPIINTAF